jgi:hypothetical protein
VTEARGTEKSIAKPSFIFCNGKVNSAASHARYSWETIEFIKDIMRKTIKELHPPNWIFPSSIKEVHFLHAWSQILKRGVLREIIW